MKISVIGGGNRISVNDLIGAIEEVTGRVATVRHVGEQKGDVKDTWADTRKAERLLGWHARIGIVQGLARYIDWIQEEP